MAKYPKTFFWKGAHAFHRILYHVVFVPKYRRRVLQGKVQQRLQFLLYQCAEVNEWFIHEIEVMDDHVHLLIQLPATISISDAVGRMKGGSAYALRKEFPELEEFLWGDSFWQDGYFAETIGRMNEAVMRNYIKNQRTPSHEQPPPSPAL